MIFRNNCKISKFLIKTGIDLAGLQRSDIFKAQLHVSSMIWQLYDLATSKSIIISVGSKRFPDRRSRKKALLANSYIVHQSLGAKYCLII